MADFQISEKLLSPVTMLQTDTKCFWWRREQKWNIQWEVKGKALEEELGSGKKKKEELESIAKRLTDTADKKAKEAEEQRMLPDESFTHGNLILPERNLKSCWKETCQLRRRQYSIWKKQLNNLDWFKVYLVKDMPVL